MIGIARTTLKNSREPEMTLTVVTVTRSWPRQLEPNSFVEVVTIVRQLNRLKRIKKRNGPLDFKMYQSSYVWRGAFSYDRKRL